MEEVTKQISTFRQSCLSRGIGKEDIDNELKCHLRSKQYKKKPAGNRRSDKTRKLLKVFFLYVLPIAVAGLAVVVAVSQDAQEYLLSQVQESECLLETNFLISEVSRPIFECDICKDLHQVRAVDTISQEEFLRKHAFSFVPVLVRKATQNWTAMDTFSFHYFQHIYENKTNSHPSTIFGDLPEGVKPDPEENDEEENPDLECQFFPYKTDFRSLKEALHMPDDRALYNPGQKPWYFGWSNCNPDVQKELRNHYQRPYFLPEDSESSNLDWMFMGGHGLGAFMHLDSVGRPSWQAQIKGKKTWTLAPPPECEHVCHTMNVTVNTGDIIVLDTNQWYHETFVHPGEISITIGSEYD